ncbi:Sec-independent protein translocase protein TatB [Xanthobacter autotrophicus]|uniref:Sec-independent protein translocase protein TatB n=1 Tax=Xanthobacter autotrophicus TaxID=280 RepID=UPI0024A632FA|nr:Sec-independent protein translocase protein TatB [Xanthobacter autotrophicus]MDI4658417.1 Sec-independent protein translocase protein TatB [Xanthobacter autotrophicus]
MFEIGWSELMLIGIVALIVIGPKELPSVLRTVGRTITKVRRMAGEFQGQFQEALREADLADMRKEISDVTESARSTLATSEMFDPLRSIREEIRTTVEGGNPPAKTPEIPAPEAPAVAAASAPLELPAAPPEAAPDAVPDPMAAIRDEIRRMVEAGSPPAGPLAAEPVSAPAAGETKSAS